MARPRILVTNDDGIVAPGIRALVEVASKYGDVTVVAPDSPQSGQGHAITLENPLRLHKVNIFDGIAAKYYADILIKKVLSDGLDGCNLLNVNIPKGDKETIKGMKICRQGQNIRHLIKLLTL